MPGVVLVPPGGVCSRPGINPDMWFPEGGNEESRPTLLARAHCQLCPVRMECISKAMSLQGYVDRGEVSGIWGGSTERMRHDIRLRNRRPQMVGADR